MRAMKRCFWECNECEGKRPDMKNVLDSITSIQSEMQKSQDDQKAERQRVLDGLKIVETVAGKMKYPLKAKQR